MSDIFALITNLTERQRTEFALSCARRVQHLMRDPLSVAALDARERWLRGEATDEEMAAAAEAAWEAAREAVWAGDGWDAARNAAWAAAWAAAADAGQAAEAAVTAAAAAEGSAATAWIAAWNAGRAAERAWQRTELARMLEGGDA